MKPILLSALGTEDDPCFGKHFDGAHPTCRKCGDSEVCLLAMGQHNTNKRKQIEASTSFKDIQPTEFMVDPAKVHQFLIAQVEEIEELRVSKALAKVNAQFYNKKGDKTEIKSMLKKILKQSKDIKTKKINGKLNIVKYGR